MRYTLHDYQLNAVRGVLNRLTMARSMYGQFGSLSQFSLTATTGAGKTVMAAAVIEALFFGSDEFDFPRDDGAVVLWFSDDPALNEQSRARLQAAGSELDSRLRVIEPTFSESKFRPGNVYFLNTQKLSKNSRLVRGAPEPSEAQPFLITPRPDDLQSSIYDVIRNTIEDKTLTLYMVLDEAHRGMGTSNKERSTIVQRLINGENGVPPIPVVWGISATVNRFQTAMKDAKNRTALPSVEVDSALVQASGLLKDDIVLDFPKEDGVFDTVLLARAVRKLKASTEAWTKYAQEQGDIAPLVPLLVVQVEDKASDAGLARYLDTIYAEWPELSLDAVANVFGEHIDLKIRQQTVPYVSPERVQDATHIRVLLAKSAISTGWDCPRAEVLVSFRPAKDETHITQLLGRMIRTPLARRIPGNELLNSVDCLLPFFDRKTATGVADMLMRGATKGNADDDGSAAGGGEGRRVLFDPVTLLPNPNIDPRVWERFGALPTVTIPKKDVKPIKRLNALAVALAHDGLLDKAVAQAAEHLHGVMDGRAKQYEKKVVQARDDVETMRGEELRKRLGGGIKYTSFKESADPRAIDDAFKAAGRTFTTSLAKSYAEHLAGEDADEDDLLEAHIQVAALGLVKEIEVEVNEAADKLAREWLTKTRVSRKGLSDERKTEYDRLEGMSIHPERISLATPQTAQTETKERLADGTENLLPTIEMHLMADEHGQYPVDLNDWEREVIASEMKHTGFKGWYRNPSRATKESLAIAYKDPSSNDWKALRPDFIFFAEQHDGKVVADLVDPHGHHLSDAMPKLRGMADFAEQFANDFRRIESVAKVGDKLRVLDLTLSEVRQAVREKDSAKALYESTLATDY